MGLWSFLVDSGAQPSAFGTAAENATLEKAFVRQYFDNGLAVYDAAGKRFGVVADYDRPGGGFIVHRAQPPAGLYLPMRLVRRVGRGKVYLSQLARNLIGRPVDAAPQVREAAPPADPGNRAPVGPHSDKEGLGVRKPAE